MNFIRGKIKLLLILLFSAVLIYFGVYILQEKELYELAKDLEKQGEVAYQKKEYKKAKSLFDRALKRYDQLIILKIFKHDEINKLKNKLSQDPIMQKVAQGYIYYQGKWINEKKLEQLLKEKRRLKQKIEIYLKTAKFFNSISDIENNISIYEDAIKTIDNSPFKNEKDIKALKTRLVAKIKELSKIAAEKYKEKGNLKKVAYYYEKLLKLEKTPDPQLKKELFDIYMRIYDDYVSMEEYSKALDTLLKAKSLGIQDQSLNDKLDFILSQVDIDEIQKKHINDPEIYYILARKAYNRIDIPEAISFLKKALRLKPDHIPSLLLYGKILYETGEIDKALEVVKKVLKLQPDNPSALLLAGDIYLKKNQVEKAISYYEKLQNMPQIKEKLFNAYKNLGFHFLTVGDYNKALNYLEKAQALKKDPQITKAIADIYFSQRNYDKALELYLQALKLNPKLKKDISPKVVKIYLDKAQKAYEEKALKQALVYYKKALAYTNNPAKIYPQIAHIYEKLGDTNSALLYYQRSKSPEAKTKKAALYLKLADKEYKQGNYFVALRHYQRAIFIEPSLKKSLRDKLSQIYIKIANRYNQQGRYSDALEFYKKAMAINPLISDQIEPKIYKLYLLLGKEYYKQGLYNMALKYLQKAKQAYSDNKEITYYLGQTYFKLGNYRKALNYLEKYAKNSNDPDIINKLAIIYMKTGNLSKANHYADLLIQHGKNLPLAYYIKGKYYYSQKNYNQALKYLLKAEASGYKNSEIYYYMGKIYYDNGKYLRAITYLTKAINNGYKNENVYYIRALSYLKLKDYRKAINDLSMVLKYNPNNARAYYLRGKLYYEHGNYVKGEYRKAISDLEKAAAMGVREAERVLNKARSKAGNE
ncbi:tetratricopeptide repeat protein [Persephonella sp.]|uniref:tetratricopeptide repeat protein n=1 Tax=Persephonella sp. TaxID=2060922 RepID=UPI00261F0678|nr:tetratricopeptide repeat protein [Persephonella sp.]